MSSQLPVRLSSQQHAPIPSAAEIFSRYYLDRAPIFDMADLDKLLVEKEGIGWVECCLLRNAPPLNHSPIPRRIRMKVHIYAEFYGVIIIKGGYELPEQGCHYYRRSTVDTRFHQIGTSVWSDKTLHA
jgi:hypothetical protein